MRLWRVGFFVEPWSSAALSNAWGWNEMSPGHSIHQTHLLHWLEFALLYSPSPAPPEGRTADFLEFSFFYFRWNLRPD